MEHFCTLFDRHFLPSAVALHASLVAQARDFRLWILCMDETVEDELKILDLPSVRLIPLREFETPELLAVKPGRTRSEYCWTITPFTFTAVFQRDKAADRVTYLDADLFFFRDPALLLDEFARSGKNVLITEHAYAPEYDSSAKHGRFCVQFLTCKRMDGGTKVMRWWQKKCLEWCFNRYEPGRFGDQKYLDRWPELFPEEVHICGHPEWTLGPWNVERFSRRREELPVFYHFHGLRIHSERRALLYSGYRVGAWGEGLYAAYVEALKTAMSLLRAHGITVPALPPRGLRPRLKRVKNFFLRRHREAELA